jgi:hypothetical protein
VGPQRTAAAPTIDAGRTRRTNRTDDRDADVLAAGQAAQAPERSTATQLLALQRHAGNQAARLAVQRRNPTGPRPTTPPKKVKGKVADPYELMSGVEEQKGGIFGTTGGGVDTATFKTDGMVQSVDQTNLAFQQDTAKALDEAAKTGQPPKLPEAEKVSASDPSKAMGFTSSVMGTTQGLLGTVASSYATQANRAELKKVRNDPESMARKRLAERSLNSSGTDVGKNVMTTSQGVADLTAKGLDITQHGSQAAANASMATGFFALPLTIFNTLRDGRKAHKAHMRCRDLEAVFNDWDNPRATVEKLQEQFATAEELRDAAETSHAGATAERQDHLGKKATVAAEIQAATDKITTLTAAKAKATGFKAKLAGAASSAKDHTHALGLKVKRAEKELELKYHDSKITSLAKEIADAQVVVQKQIDEKKSLATRLEQSRKALDEMTAVVGSTGRKAMAAEQAKAKGKGSSVERVDSGATGGPSLLEIQAYALQKNKSGTIKKVISTVGGVLSVGGAAASLAVALAAAGVAGGVALMATPIGWGLAGAAAAVGLGLAGYKAFKWLRKRWQQSAIDPKTGAKRGFGAHLGKTLAVWTPAGKSRREKYGVALLDMALGHEVFLEQKEKAQQLVGGLGVKWASLGLGALEANPPKVHVTGSQAFDHTDASNQGGEGKSTKLASGPSRATNMDADATTKATGGGPANQKLVDMKAEAKRRKQMAWDHETDPTKPAPPAPDKALLNYKAAKELITAKLGS